MKIDRVVKIFFILFLLADFVFSFFQYYNTPLFGDIETGVLPDENVQKIIDDPFGLKILRSGEGHVNPNRFFSHFLFMEYFRNIPILLQNMTDSISSVYLSAAIVKIFVQILFILLIAAFISGTRKFLSTKFLLAAVLVTPLFQAYGFWSRMGINDKSIAYTFFYAVPLVLLMLFLLPVFNNLYKNTNLRKRFYVCLIPLILILPLSGPLIPAVILLVTMLIITNIVSQNQLKQKDFKSLFEDIPEYFYVLLLPASLVSLYSLFLGFYDLNYESELISLGERFLRIPIGIYSQVFHSLGYPLMLFIIGINVYALNKTRDQEALKLIEVFKWIGVFIFLYIVLLPFGGYRPYRPNIIRYDTIMPITTAFIYFFGASAYYLLNYLKGRALKMYIVLIISVLMIFSAVDIKGLGKNECEKTALMKIAESAEKIVSIPNNCFVLSWENISDYKQSENKAELIYRWNITKEKKLFYNEQE